MNHPYNFSSADCKRAPIPVILLIYIYNFFYNVGDGILTAPTTP